MSNIYDGFFSVVNGLKSKVLITAPETFLPRPLTTSSFPSFLWIGVTTPSNPVLTIFFSVFVVNVMSKSNLEKNKFISSYTSR